MPENTARTPRITVIGDALIDELRGLSGTRAFVGGAALNVAVGLSLLGDDVTLVAMVGDDEPGAHIRAYLADYGVRLVASPSAFGTSRAVSDRRDGEPRYAFNEAAQHRTIAFDAETRSSIDAAELVVVSCFPFDDHEQTAELRAAIADPAHRLVVDGNPRAGMLHDRAAFLEGFEAIAAESLLVKVGDEDADLLLSEPLATFVAQLRTRADASTARPSTAAPLAVLATAGREGAAIHHGAATIEVGIVDLPGPVVDTMGAGDATAAAVTHRIATDGLPTSEREWREVLEAAMSIAAATVRHEGALLRRPPGQGAFADGSGS